MKTFLDFPLRELHHSKRSNIYFVKIAANDWRHVDASSDKLATVGPIYRTRSELLADSNRYCREAWNVE